MLVTSTELFKKAKKQKFAIPAVNYVDQYTLKSYIAVAEELNFPIITSFAQAHEEIMPLEEAALLGRYYAEKAKVPVVLHLDHGEDVEFVKNAVDLGFSSVMIDASQESFEENVRRTKEVIEYAHAQGVVVEAEIGHVGSGKNYENHEHSDSVYTTVDQAKEFYEVTKVDSLAISIGTAHGNYIGAPSINFKRLIEINQKLQIPLVLHGGSSSGDENLKICTQNGIVKINIFTDIIQSAVKDLIVENKNYFDIQEKMVLGMKKCLHRYFTVFQTKQIL